MPLRDHFHPPAEYDLPWDAVHGAWPTMMAMAIKKALPPDYQAMPNIHLGTGSLEVDVGTYERAGAGSTAAGPTTAAVWTAPKPRLDVPTVPPSEDVYEVRIRQRQNLQLVATIEIVSPSNKDRPENRRAFVAKCAALVRQRVSVTIVDVVASRHFNLYADLLDFLGQSDPEWVHAPPHLYASTCRNVRHGSQWSLQTWADALAVGQPLPTLPIWLNEDVSVPLPLEQTYEATCDLVGMK